MLGLLQIAVAALVLTGVFRQLTFTGVMILFMVIQACMFLAIFIAEISSFNEEVEGL